MRPRIHEPLSPLRKRAPLNLNIVGECLSCGLEFVVFMPVGSFLTCGCGDSLGTDCPRCGEAVSFEAAPLGNEPVLLQVLNPDGSTVEMP